MADTPHAPHPTRPIHDPHLGLRVAAFSDAAGPTLVRLSFGGMARGLARACAADIAALDGGALQWPASEEGRVAATLSFEAAQQLAAEWQGAPGLAAVGGEIARALAARSGALQLADGRRLAYRPRPLIMGILNLTPDSFYAASRASGKDAVAWGVQMAEEGADLIDVGGESTRPGADPVSEQEERQRVVPAIRELVRAGAPPISIDSRKPGVARAALDEGAVMLNDVGGLFEPEMASLAAERGVPTVVMHMRGTPATMQQRPHYDDVVGEVLGELKARINAAVAAGVAVEQLLVDPGIGFGKRAADNLALLSSAGVFGMLGPVMIGASRKSFLGTLLDVETDDRLVGTLAAHAAAQLRGADVLRVHDVAAAVQAATVVAAVRGGA